MSLIKATSVATAISFLFSGCAAPVISYRGQVGDPPQSLTHAQGVGTLTTRTEDDEILMYPTFKTQGAKLPTFSIAYANNTSKVVNFSTENVKAFFRGKQVPIYTYTQRVAEIRTDKRNAQIALAILGVIAIAGAAQASSRTSYTSHSSGSVWNRYGSTHYSGFSSATVYDPMAGMVAGAAVAGATGLAIHQMEYSAANEEAAANSILQENTVNPQQMVQGELVVKDCCEAVAQPNDILRFEVTVNGKITMFQFVRQIAK